MYDDWCTTLGMLVSSSPPHAAGLQLPLAELLLERGAALETPGERSNAAVLTALAFGYLDTARGLAARDGQPRDVAVAAGLGLLGETARLLPTAHPERVRAALVLGCMHGHVRIVRLLLDAGADPNQYNPDGFHAHSTPLHQAVWAGHENVVRVLVESGARADLRDRVHEATPLDWATHGQRAAIADYLRAGGEPSPAVTT
jgi:ankyrin repeat protein